MQPAAVKTDRSHAHLLSITYKEKLCHNLDEPPGQITSLATKEVEVNFNKSAGGVYVPLAIGVCRLVGPGSDTAPVP
jgi:hypothetical protein